MKSKSWKKYAFEFLSIFVAVVSAFALTNWNDNRRDAEAERQILTEIVHGLKQDESDMRDNMKGHKMGLETCTYFRKILMDQEVKTDSLMNYYFRLTRDFLSIQNTSGYETLKSKGFELLENDSLRTKIISLYEFDFQILRKFEEEYNENQFQENYFHEINKFIAPHFIFDADGNMVDLKLPLVLNESDRKILISYIWKIQANRQFILRMYEDVIDKIKELRKEIEKEI